jgi:hypothetical protein
MSCLPAAAAISAGTAPVADCILDIALALAAAKFARAFSAKSLSLDIRIPSA